MEKQSANMIGGRHTIRGSHRSVLPRLLSSSFLLLFLLFSVSSSTSILLVRALQLSSPTFIYPGDLNRGTQGLYTHTFGLFGPDPLTYNVTGPLYYNEADPTFCDLAAIDLNAVKGKIVLAIRDPACVFLLRAQNAQLTGALGVIIGDNKISSVFDTPFMGPYREPPEVNIPTIFVTGATFQLMFTNSTITNKSAYLDTIASITKDGLYADLDDYYAQMGGNPHWSPSVRTIIILLPFLMVIACYFAFYSTYQRPASNNNRRAPAPAPASAPAPAQRAAPAPAPIQPIVNAVPVPAATVQASPTLTSTASSASFTEGDLSQISLPVPPHLSTGDSKPDDQLADVALDVISPAGGRAVRSSSVDEFDHRENEGLMTADSVHATAAPVGSSSSSAPASNANSSNREASRSSQVSASLRADNGNLNRPLLNFPTIAPHLRLYYNLLQLISAAGKPWAILRLNAIVYAIHIVWSFYVLVKGWNEVCVNENLAVVSLWCARAFIGFRICYWQTHSSSAPPTCGDIFFKNWSDCIYLFTGSMFTWNEAQKADCQTYAPTIYAAIQAWTVILYITYGLRILCYVADKYVQRHSNTMPHLFSIGFRSGLTLLNGGFSCAGPLDKNQPATQLDLMLIPTVTFQQGMFPQDDAICGVCLGEYSDGETLRILHCSHHYHAGCVDQWLLQKSSCPTCRSSIDDPHSNVRGRGNNSPSSQEGEQDNERQDRPPSPSRVEAVDYNQDEERVPPHSYFNAQQMQQAQQI